MFRCNLCWRWWRVMRWSREEKYSPIFSCSSCETGTANSVFDTKFQSALGIFDPADWLAISSNRCVWISRYIKLLSALLGFKTHQSPTATPEKSGFSQLWRYGQSFPYNTWEPSKTIPFLIFSFRLISLFNLPSSAITSSYSRLGKS